MKYADRAVFFTSLAALCAVIGMGIGEARVRHQIATVCQPQPGAMLVASYQDPRDTAISCAYVDNMPTARQLRRAAATRAL